MIENKDDPSNIAQRLEKLNQWQEEQKRILFERQDNQRKLLGLEHKKMYEMLGIFHAEHSLLDENDDANESNETAEHDTSLGVSILDQSANVQTDYHQGTVDQSEKPKRTFLRRKQGLMNRFKMDPDQFRLNKLPPYKFSSNHPSVRNKVAEKTKDVTNRVEVKTNKVDVKKDTIRPLSKCVLKLRSDKKSINPYSLDLLEEKFQKSLILSKTACNSTPDVKSQSSSIKETPEPISWAAILDPQNIKPIEKPSFHSTRQESQDESDNLSIFELLEQKAQHGSFDFDSSCIKKFLRKTQTEESNTTFESPISMKLPPVPYEVYRNNKSVVSDSSDTEAEEIEPSTPRLSTHVRFADNPHTVTPAPNISEVLDNSDATQVFEEFKRLIFANQSEGTITESFQAGGALAQEILQKADLIKARLQELESEIATFKQNNMDLVKSKQEHELDKAHFEQERLESLEKLNDERIQMEIYLHDERMKIEDERKKMEKQVKNQKSLTSNKEKKENSKLREEVESLQRELKKKEEAHISAQSRMRAQIRNLEKDVRQLNSELDAINKENKRLESENLKINRQNNNKMLQEINRNIAKLAPKGSPLAYIDESPSEKVSTTAQQKSKSKSTTRRRSSEVKRKPSPIQRQSSTTVHSTDGGSSSESSDEFSKPALKVTFAKSPPPPNKREESTDKSKTTETQPDSADASFKREIRNPDGSKDIWYPNGNLKKISTDGMIIRMLYFNKDIKETNINEGTVKYYYAETNTWHTTYLDGLEILEFPNGQTEHRYKDGRIEVHFPNNSIKVTNPADEHKLEEWRFADGTNLIQMKNGDKILLLSNGQKEIHTTLSKRREYPDGTVKLVYPDGSQETRYSNGRVRLKDKEGHLVMDTENVKY